ncbi:MAG: YhbD family protein [Saccharofermentans sp.]|nr:YhbD family protein [Saccharofermentans sp.]
MADEELISKKQLLRVAQISYGTLYRWKRMNLIPESWFIHKATDIGQATYFPRTKILTRIDRIKELKNELTVEQMQELFSANVKSFKIPLDDFRSLEIVSKLSITAFCADYPEKTMLDFNDVFSMYVVDHLMHLNGFYLEDAKQVLKLLCKYLAVEASKDYQLLLLRKMGVPMTVLVHGEDEILLEDNTEIIACANLVEFEEALKDRLIA